MSDSRLTENRVSRFKKAKIFKQTNFTDSIEDCAEDVTKPTESDCAILIDECNYDNNRRSDDDNKGRLKSKFHYPSEVLINTRRPLLQRQTCYSGEEHLQNDIKNQRLENYRLGAVHFDEIPQYIESVKKVLPQNLKHTNRYHTSYENCSATSTNHSNEKPILHLTQLTQFSCYI